MPTSKVQQAKEQLEKKSPVPKGPSDSDYLSTGVTLLNLGLHGRTNGGIVKGGCYRLNGRSSGGKTFVCRTILAEAAANSAFDKYDLIYDDVEHGALMDTEKFFGHRLMKRLRPPAWYKASGRPYYSRTTEEFYTRLRKRLEEGKKTIWIEDSLDALDGANTTKMTDNKAKIHSQELRRLMDPLSATGSILILVSQARANMNKHSPWEPEDIVAGGRALEHYPNADIQLRKSKTLRKPYKGVKYVVGSIIRAQIAKNRISGGNHTVFFPFFPSYGIDDLGANVDYLLFVKHWKKQNEKEDKTIEYDEGDDEDETGGGKTKVIAPEFNFQGTKEQLISHIEKESLERELQVLVGACWKEIESACQPERKSRYE